MSTSHTIALFNQKGGVGKTTTAINLAAYLAQSDRVLLIDMDPQGNASSGVGGKASGGGLYTALGDPARTADLTQPVGNFDLLAATPDLAGAGVELADDPDALARVLASVGGYDWILVDSPPSLSPLTVNILAAVRLLLIPVQAEYYALEGLASVIGTAERVREGLNPHLDILGILLTMQDTRTRLGKEVEESVRSHGGEQVFRTVIPRSVRLSEAPSHAQPILSFAPLSQGALAYEALAKEVKERV